jgi:glycerol-3-phosphate O-acyltransferase
MHFPEAHRGHPVRHAVGSAAHEAAPEPHPTAMLERPGPLLRWLFRRFFTNIDFPAALAERVRDAAARGTVVYVCRTLSYIDYLYFTYAFLLHGLPLSRFANGVKTLLFQPVGRLLRGLLTLWRRRHESSPARGPRELADEVRRGESVLLFLRRPRTLLGWEPAGFRGAYVEELIRIQRERAPDAPPIIFVPLTILWGSAAVRAARTRRGIIDIVFGEREAPGRLRELWNFFTHLRESQVLGAEAIDLRDWLARESGSDEVLARRLRWQLGGRLETEVRVVLGPARKSASRIRKEVMQGRKLVAEAQAIARADQAPPAVVARRAEAYLKEIAAVPTPWVIDVFMFVLRWVWRRIFDGLEIDFEGLERVREAARRGPLLLVPTHKSHIDYLVLSYVFIENDLVPPYIAAGKNLAFWPLGPFLRRGGAFFLRRSFRGDKLYSTVFRAYVRKLLREGNSIEFFIEGGRSRTGKVLGPRLGLLGMVVEAALDDDGARARRAQVVPISIGYEKVIEERSYARELAGGEKRAEDMRGLLRATKVLGKSYGRVNIQFDTPFSLGAALREAGAIWAWDEDEQTVVLAPPPSPSSPSSETDAGRRATVRLAHRIVHRMSQVTAVTPTALAAAALLGPGRRGIARADLIAQAEFLAAHARAVGGRLSQALVDRRGQLDLDALDRALDLLARDGDIEVRGRGAAAGVRAPDEIYIVPDERRPRLAYYRNNAIHLFVSDGLVALSLAATGVAPRHVVRARTLALSRLLKLEFSYRVDATFDTIFDDTVAAMAAAGLLAAERGEVTDDLRPLAAARLSLLAGQVRDVVESYLIVARGLETLAAPLVEKELLRRIHELGETLFFTGEVRRREACARATYQIAIDYFKQSGALVVDGDGDGKLRLAPGVEAARLRADIAELLPPE